MASRAEQKESRRQKILDVALDLFIRHGYAAVRIKDIAENAGMSMGLMFHYFESKEAVYSELLKIGINAPQLLSESLKGLEPLRFFEECARIILSEAQQSEFTAKMFILMNRVGHGEGIGDDIKKLGDGLDAFYAMTRLIEEGQKQGTIRQGNPLALCNSFWAAIQGAIESYVLYPDIPLPEYEWLVDIIKAK